MKSIKNYLMPKVKIEKKFKSEMKKLQNLLNN